ncbi:hypothetical protein HER32_06660 [Hymenobacter sp. BT18]|uniref:DUF6712 family protein n=1 Tax=Hymenobacter sp. BT18 TaxID=2835648 RepID=UPI00143E3462|nr:DUF6712 family protein [Hymenobacter sp. BT18]QIX60874.1 hypothetical protein HER32_06660 [Hymenobacter sp. BT18]
MALLKTVDELNCYVKVNINSTQPIPDAIQLQLIQVEQLVIRRLLGKELYQWLVDQYNTTGDQESLASELLALVQAPLARLATAGSVEEHQVTVDSTGIHFVATETQKTAFPWQVKALQKALIWRGNSDLDVLVQWLEDNREAPELAPWLASPASELHRRGLFTCTAEFQEHVDISSSRVVYEALAPVRRRLEDFELSAVLSPAFLSELREQIRTRTLTSENENLLRSYVHPALANLSFAKAVPELGLRIAPDGIELKVARIDDSNAKEADASLDQLMLLKTRGALDDGHRYLRRLEDYLNRQASTTSFPTYFASSRYTAPDTPVVPVNSSTTRIFKFF